LARRARLCPRAAAGVVRGRYRPAGGAHAKRERSGEVKVAVQGSRHTDFRRSRPGGRCVVERLGRRRFRLSPPVPDGTLRAPEAPIDDHA